jgi:hypothetical protein
MSKKHLLFVLLIIFANLNCKDIYFPEIRSSERVLVIKGLITDDLESQYVKLSKAVPFDTAFFMPKSKANVYVTDDLNKKYTFAGTIAGYYKTNSGNFKPDTGRRYQLFITTFYKKKYSSS